MQTLARGGEGFHDHLLDEKDTHFNLCQSRKPIIGEHVYGICSLERQESQLGS